MTIEPFDPFHVKLLVAQGVQGAQVNQLSHVPASYASVVQPAGPALTVRNGTRIVLCGGIATMSPKLGIGWAILAADAGRHMVFLHRAVLRFFDTVPIRRLEATVEKGFGAGCRWLDMLGFKYEGDMPGYGEDGETHMRYGRVRL